MRKIKKSFIGLLIGLFALLVGCVAGLLIVPQATQTASAASISDLTFTEASNKASYSVKATDRNTISGNLVIPSTYNGKPVTSIGYQAFHNCPNLISVTIPDSVTSIGASAFSGSVSLSSLELGNGVTRLNDSFINGCSSLHSLVVPSSVTLISDYAFSNSSLVTIVIPNTVQRMSRGSFNSCNSLTTISFLGTRAEWDAIPKSSASIPDSVVVECLDVDL